MHHPAVQYTLSIFERMHDYLPPLVPADIVALFEQNFNDAQTRHEIKLEELEDIMSHIGKQVWPYMRAFEHIYQHHAEKMGEQILHQRASHPLRQKLHMFKEMGGTFDDVYHGRAAEMLDHDERTELMRLLVELKYDIRKHATQAVFSQDRNQYEEMVEKYGKMVEEINTVLDDVKKFVAELDHDGLKQDMYSHLRSCDHGFAMLGPRMGDDAIRNIQSHYEGRRDELLKR